MKTLLALLLFFSPFVASADIADDVAAAIRTGNAKEISKYFADNVDLKVLEQENIYSKAQAELILKDFFANPWSNDIFFNVFFFVTINFAVIFNY